MRGLNALPFVEKRTDSSHLMKRWRCGSTLCATNISILSLPNLAHKLLHVSVASIDVPSKQNEVMSTVALKWDKIWKNSVLLLFNLSPFTREHYLTLFIMKKKKLPPLCRWFNKLQYDTKYILKIHRGHQGLYVYKYFNS